MEPPGPGRLPLGYELVGEDRHGHRRPHQVLRSDRGGVPAVVVVVVKNRIGYRDHVRLELRAEACARNFLSRKGSVS